jgi:UDP-arabinose 4-epimerase
VGESVEHPDRYFQNNVVNTLALLDGMRDAEVKDFIFSSSCATYGIPVDVPVDESHPQVPMSPYGDTKLACEKILRAYERAFGVKWVALRYFNAAGGDPDGEIGETHRPETHLIPNAIRGALGETSALDLFGTDYPTPDGTAIRDYVHVLDLADAHCRALAHLWNGGESVALNFGTGRGNSVREIIRSVEEVSGRSVPVRERPRRPGDVPGLWAKTEAALSTLGWQARFVDIRETVEHAYKWAKQGWKPISHRT